MWDAELIILFFDHVRHYDLLNVNLFMKGRNIYMLMTLTTNLWHDTSQSYAGLKLACRLTLRAYFNCALKAVENQNNFIMLCHYI